MQLITAAAFHHEFKILAEFKYDLTFEKDVVYYLFQIRDRIEVIINIHRNPYSELFLSPLKDMDILRALLSQHPDPVALVKTEPLTDPLIPIEPTKLDHCEIKPETVKSFFFHCYPTGLKWDKTMGMQKQTIEKIFENHNMYMEQLYIEWKKIVAANPVKTEVEIEAVTSDVKME